MNKTQKDELKDLNTHANDPLLNQSAVAEALGRSPQTIGRWIVDGLLPSVLLPSGLRKVRKSVLQQWLDATTIGQDEEIQYRVAELTEEPEPIPDLGLPTPTPEATTNGS